MGTSLLVKQDTTSGVFVKRRKRAAQYGFRVLRRNIHQEVFRVFELQQSDPSTVDRQLSCTNACAETRSWTHQASQWKDPLDPKLSAPRRCHGGPNTNSLELQRCGNKATCKEPTSCTAQPIGVTDPITFQSVGQEEYELAAVKTQHEQSLKRLTKAILRMTAAWGLESGLHVGAEAAKADEVCQAGQASGNDGNQWLWVAMFSCF